MPRIPSALVAGVSLLVGFAVADAAPERWIGGLVLVAGAVWCVLREARRTPWYLLVVVVVLAGGAFAAAHRLADILGAWPAVLLAAGVVAAVTWVLVDRPHPSSEQAPA